MRRVSFWLLVSQLALGSMVFGCAESDTKKPLVGDKPNVASRPGIVQVGGPNDPVIDEASACSRFRTALQTGATRLQCTQLLIGECPALVHPLVDLPCIMYSEPSVVECERVFSAATTCDELAPGSCVLTAILDPTDSSGMLIECADRDSTSSDTTASNSDANPAVSSTDDTGSDPDSDTTSVITTSTDTTSGVTHIPADTDAGATHDAGTSDASIMPLDAGAFEAGVFDAGALADADVSSSTNQPNDTAFNDAALR